MQHQKDVFKIAFEQLYGPLLAYTKTLTNNPEQAKDIVQNCFITLWQKRPDLLESPTLKSFLFTTAYNSFIDLYRKNKRKNKILDNLKYSMAKEYIIEEESTQKSVQDSVQDNGNSGGVFVGEYKPPFTITNEILSYVSSISEKIGRITAIRSLETKPHLRKNNRIKSIHSSLKIEANSLSLGQVRDVINGRLVLGEQKEIQEVKNAYAAYESLSEINPYSIKDLKKFHGIMTKYLVEEYGEFRHGEEGVFNGDECIFMAPPAQFVPQLMDELFEWMKKSRNSVHPLIMSSVFHYEFVFIHPFADGNGRMARLWHTAILSKWKPVFEYIPIESRIEKFQDEYYDAIARCHVSGESTIFIEFMLSQIDRILEDISLQMNEENEQFSETVRKMLEIMEYDTPYTRKTLMEKLGLKSRDGFRRNYLQPALEMNLIQMTLPDKPNSRNQRYMKV